MKPGDIVKVTIGNFFYNQYVDKYAIVSNIYLTDDLKEICTLRIFMTYVTLNNALRLKHVEEKMYTFRLVKVS
jgi:hypothetical protein